MALTKQANLLLPDVVVKERVKAIQTPPRWPSMAMVFQ